MPGLEGWKKTEASGLLAARLSSVSLRTDGIYNGIVLWGMTWLLFAWLATSAMAALLGGVFNVFGATVQGVGTAATAVATKAGDGWSTVP